MTTYWDFVDANSFLQNEIEGYEKPVRKKYRSVLSELKVKSMLEVGCGPGVDYIGAIRTLHNINYTGVDLTPQLIEHCKKQYPKGTFILGDIYHLPFETSAFDLVYCKDLLNHLEHWTDGFSELLRVSNKYILVNFFYGLGSTTFNEKTMKEGYLNHFYDWNEVMTKLVSFKPASLTVYTLSCNPNEETMILFQKT